MKEFSGSPSRDVKCRRGANGLASDECYSAAINAQIIGIPTPPFQIPGRVWNVGWSGSGNQYGDDGIGRTTGSMDWYRRHLPKPAFPCAEVAPQAMCIVNDIGGFGDQWHVNHTISYMIDYPQGVLATEDGVSQTAPYRGGTK